MKESCNNCRFKISNDCRRYPPQLIYIPLEYEDGKYETEYPDAKDWCGEWKEAIPTISTEVKKHFKESNNGQDANPIGNNATLRKVQISH